MYSVYIIAQWLYTFLISLLFPGDRPIHIAAKNQCMIILAQLYRLGADINAPVSIAAGCQRIFSQKNRF